MKDPTNTITTENVVATSSMGRELDLEELNRDLPRAEFNPSYFSGLVYRFQTLDPVCLIFTSGKVVCTGASNPSEASDSINLLFRRIRELGLSIEESQEINVNNIVSSANLQKELDLNAVAIGLGIENVEYEPEQFPGLLYRFKSPNVVILLFSSGKVVVTGAKEESEVFEGVEQIVQKLSSLGLYD
jgi:transcription initiation factor TFIID TATA-box-binding protein